MVKETQYIVLDIETTGLNPYFGDRITCICAKTEDKEKFVMSASNKGNSITEESYLLEQFLEWLDMFETSYALITKNGKMFDIPFILERCRVNVLQAPYFLLDVKQIDLQEITSKRVSLQNMAELLCLDGKYGSGENAIKLALNNEWEKLEKYCFQDVELTEEIYLLRNKMLFEDALINKLSSIY